MKNLLAVATGLFLVCPLHGLTAEAIEPLFPKALAPGDTIAMVAPAGPLDREKMELARQRLEALGFETQMHADLYRETGYLAGADEIRAEELNSAFRDKTIDAIFPGTGGYGTTRILDQLDYEVIRANPKILIGFSDITALHVAVNQMTGLVTFHSPNPMWGLGNENNLSPLAARFFWRALLAEEYAQDRAGYTISATSWSATADEQWLAEHCELAPPTSFGSGTAQGRLIGGNLSLIVATMGTPYEIITKGRVLFLEDIGEAPYRVDRMLCTLRLAGKLEGLAGAVLGQFTRRKTEDTSDEVTTIDEVLESYFKPLNVPVISNFPLGHHRCNITLPVGVLCEINAESKTIRLLENPVHR